MLHLQFPVDVQVPVAPADGPAFSSYHPGTATSYQPSSIHFALRQYFDKVNMQTACEECECSRDECERIREPPELLLLHLNRIDVVQGRARKIRRLIQYNKDLRLDKAYFDPRLARQGGRRGFRSKKEQDDLTCYYELFWVGLHNGESHQEGHYHCMAKGRRDWAFLDDQHTGVFDEAEFKSERAESQSYLFGYRRINPEEVQEHPELLDPVRKIEDKVEEKMDVDEPKKTESSPGHLPDLTADEWGMERDKVGRLELRFTGSNGAVQQSTDLVGVAYNPPEISAGKGLWRVGLPCDKTGTMTLNWYDNQNHLVESCSMKGLLKDSMVARAKSRSRSRSGSRNSKGSRHSEKKAEEPKPDEPKPEEPISGQSSLANRFKDLLASPSKVEKKTETKEERHERRRKKKEESEKKKEEKQKKKDEKKEEKEKKKEEKRKKKEEQESKK
ncbi:hypothetical protein N7540_000461 [Penicillium herquei]|nr:hypothetical protein N7540_000461 [Penicillium herquei]